MRCRLVAVLLIAIVLGGEGTSVAQTASSLRSSLDQASSVISLLEIATDLDSAHSSDDDFEHQHVVVSRTFIDKIFGGKSGRDWPTFLKVMMYSMFGMAGLSILAIPLSLARVVWSRLGLPGFLFWTAFFALALHMALMSTELAIANYGLVWLGQWLDQVRGSVSAPELQHSALQSAVQLGLFTSSTSSTGLRDLSFLADEGHVFCAATWEQGNTPHNRYPSGSRVHEYNLRRVADIEHEADPDMDYIKTLMTQSEYPPPGLSGGVTSEQARLLGAISNECEEFHGDVEQCCDDELNPTQELRQLRCPGKVLYQEGASNNCACLQVMTRMGLVVENDMTELCLAHIRDQVKDSVMQLFGVDMSVYNMGPRNLTAVFGCTGVYDASRAEVEGNAARKRYSEAASPQFDDASSFPDSSAYVLPEKGTAELTRVTWELSACLEGTHTFQLRTGDFEGADRKIVVTVDGQHVFERVLTAPGLGVWSEKAVIFQVPIAAGRHRVTVTANDGAIVPLHRLIVCQDGSSQQGCLSLG